MPHTTTGWGWLSKVDTQLLEKLDLLADCANRRLIPNPAHPDQPVTKVK
jgi:hypothetical protein